MLSYQIYLTENEHTILWLTCPTDRVRTSVELMYDIYKMKAPDLKDVFKKKNYTIKDGVTITIRKMRKSND